MKALLYSVYTQPDVDAVTAQYDQMATTLADHLPAAAEHLGHAREDVLAFTHFPKELWKKIWSNNPNERLNKEIRSLRTLVECGHPEALAIPGFVPDAPIEITDFPCPRPPSPSVTRPSSASHCRPPPRPEHRLGHVAGRKIRPGPHRIEAQVNGRNLDGVVIEVTADGA